MNTRRARSLNPASPLALLFWLVTGVAVLAALAARLVMRPEPA